MRYEEISPIMRAFLAGWEALRMLGFSADDITFAVAPSAAFGGHLSVFVLLRAQSKEFKMECGPVEDADEALAEYVRVATAVSQNEVPQQDLDRIWQESLCFRQPLEFAQVLLSKGFTIPRSTN